MADAAPAAARQPAVASSTPTARPDRAGPPQGRRPEAWLAYHLADAGALGLPPLLQAARQFTPFVSPEPPDGMLAEVQASLKLFGGAEALHARAVMQLREAGIHACVALAPTARAGLWLARAGQACVVLRADALPTLAARLPLSSLRWPIEALEALRQLGCCSVADLIRLPRDGLARRLGPALLAELDEGLGRRPMPRRRYAFPERFHERIELAAECELAGQLEPAALQLLARLGGFLRQRAAGISVLRLDLEHRGQPPTRLRLALAHPGNDTLHFARLLHERLGQAPLPAPVRALALRTGVPQPLAARTQGLFGRRLAADPDAQARLLESLRVRLGEDAVFALRLVAEHRPERGWRVAEPALDESRAAAGASPVNPRPFWLLATPRCLEGPPGELLSGPERIESGWWDGHDVRRDYYVARTGAGARLWVFRERGPGRRWFLHGLFG